MARIVRKVLSNFAGYGGILEWTMRRLVETQKIYAPARK
jgi:hypothetical protein